MPSDDPPWKPSYVQSDSTSMTLLERLRTSDEEAWRRTIFLYKPLVVYWCRRKGIRIEDAEDVAQEVFRVVAASIERFRRDRPGESFRGWLRGVANNKALAWHRQSRKQPSAIGGTEAGLILGGAEAESEEPEEDDPRELASLHRRALDLVKSEFEAKTWLAFWKVAVDGNNTADVAAELGLSVASVRQAKSRVLRRLREELGDVIA